MTLPTNEPGPGAGDDRAFDALLEQLDLLGSDDPDVLAAAETRLQGEGGLHGQPDDQPTTTPEVPRRWWNRRGWRVAAALLLAAALLTAAVSVIWSAGARSLSGGTMNYRMAIDLIEQPAQRSDHRRSAMMFTMQWTAIAIDGLHRVAGDPATPPELVALATAELARARSLLGSSAVVPATRDVLETVARDCRAVALDAGRPLAERTQQVQRLGSIAAVGIVTLRDMQTGGGVLEEGRLIHLGAIRRLLGD